MSQKGKQVGGNHYESLPIQPTDYIHQNGMGFIAGNIVKYVTRYKFKNGLEDLRKAQHYLTQLIEYEQKAMAGSHDDMPADNHWGMDMLSEDGGD